MDIKQPRTFSGAPNFHAAVREELCIDGGAQREGMLLAVAGVTRVARNLVLLRDVLSML